MSSDIFSPLQSQSSSAVVNNNSFNNGFTSQPISYNNSNDSCLSTKTSFKNRGVPALCPSISHSNSTTSHKITDQSPFINSIKSTSSTIPTETGGLSTEGSNSIRWNSSSIAIGPRPPIITTSNSSFSKLNHTPTLTLPQRPNPVALPPLPNKHKPQPSNVVSDSISTSNITSNSPPPLPSRPGMPPRPGTRPTHD